MEKDKGGSGSESDDEEELACGSSEVRYEGEAREEHQGGGEKGCSPDGCDALAEVGGGAWSGGDETRDKAHEGTPKHPEGVPRGACEEEWAEVHDACMWQKREDEDDEDPNALGACVDAADVECNEYKGNSGECSEPHARWENSHDEHSEHGCREDGARTFQQGTEPRGGNMPLNAAADEEHQ